MTNNLFPHDTILILTIYYFQSEECSGCDYWTLGTNIQNQSSFEVNATFPQRFKIVDQMVKDRGENINCHSFLPIKSFCIQWYPYNFSYFPECSLRDVVFWENGVYRLRVQVQDLDMELLKCSIDVIDAPDDPYIPILVAFVILFTVPVLTTAIYKSRAVRRGLVWICVRYAWIPILPTTDPENASLFPVRKFKEKRTPSKLCRSLEIL